MNYLTWPETGCLVYLLKIQQNVILIRLKCIEYTLEKTEGAIKNRHDTGRRQTQQNHNTENQKDEHHEPHHKKQRVIPYTCKRTNSPCLPQDTHHVTHRELHISFFFFLQYYCLFLRHTQTGNLIDNWEYYLGGGWYVNYIFPILAHWPVLWFIIRSVFSRYNKLVNKKNGETHCPTLLMIRDEEFSCTKVHHTGHII